MANFANDFYTFPVRLKLQLFDGLNWINDSISYSLNLVPGSQM